MEKMEKVKLSLYISPEQESDIKLLAEFYDMKINHLFVKAIADYIASEAEIRTREFQTSTVRISTAITIKKTAISKANTAPLVVVQSNKRELIISLKPHSKQKSCL